jgi:S-adenosylmethionine synthetase
MCDQISDAILDAHLSQDPDAKVACGKKVKLNFLILVYDVAVRRLGWL